MDDLGKKILPQALKSCPKCNKLPHLVTLKAINIRATAAWFESVRTGISSFIMRDQTQPTIEARIEIMRLPWY